VDRSETEWLRPDEVHRQVLSTDPESADIASCTLSVLFPEQT